MKEIIIFIDFKKVLGECYHEEYLFNSHTNVEHYVFNQLQDRYNFIIAKALTGYTNFSDVFNVVYYRFTWFIERKKQGNYDVVLFDNTMKGFLEYFKSVTYN